MQFRIIARSLVPSYDLPDCLAPKKGFLRERSSDRCQRSTGRKEGRKSMGVRREKEGEKKKVTYRL